MPENKYIEMIPHLSEHPEVKIDLPVGYKQMALENTNEDELYPCCLAAFQSGDSQFFPVQNDTERHNFNGTLGFDGARNEVGSSMMLKGDQIVGFTFVAETNRHISCMCVHEGHQRQGLGIFMLIRAIRAASAKGYKTITLWTETAMGAFLLYRKYGFEIGG